MLFTLTTVVNLLALAISLWLGFYIVTRSPRSRLSWLATLTPPNRTRRRAIRGVAKAIQEIERAARSKMEDSA